MAFVGSIRNFLCACIVLVCIYSVHCKPISAANETDLELTSSETLTFLTKYGYLDQKIPFKSSALLSEDSLTDAIKEVQRIGHLPQTGQLDNATVTLMRSPRCGRKDKVPHVHSKRQKRFSIIGNPWEKRYLTFFVASWLESLGRDAVAKNIQKALDIWAPYGGLQFKEVFHPQADIIVTFGVGEHGDGDPFDGPGRTLAHAYPPSRYGFSGIEGDIHFDADEPWTMDPQIKRGVNFFDVALHELGHSLGLGHSEDGGAVMYPYYRGQSNKLGHDDIAAMNHLYGTEPEQSLQPLQPVWIYNFLK